LLCFSPRFVRDAQASGCKAGRLLPFLQAICSVLAENESERCKFASRLMLDEATAFGDLEHDRELA
jgi:hypothetical protein